jgi:hypothetical protein
MDEFRVWKSARSDVQIKDNYQKVLVGTEADLVGYWKVDDEPNSMTALDSASGAGHTARLGVYKTNSAAERQWFASPMPPSPVCP